MRAEAWFKMKPVSTTRYRHPAIAKVGKEMGCSILSRTNRRPSCAGLTRVSTRSPAAVHCARGRPDQVRPWLSRVL